MPRVASDGNLAMHFDGFDAGRFSQGLLMSQLYFQRSTRLSRKARDCRKRGDQVINFPADLSPADELSGRSDGMRPKRCSRRP